MTNGPDPAFWEVVPPVGPRTSEPADPDTLSLFDVPRIETPPPVAPGSESSRRAALDLSSPFRRKSWRRIMYALAVADKPLTREEIAERTGYKESSLCARISELRPVWIEAVSCYAKSAAGVEVDAYRLTQCGRERTARGVEAA